MDNTELDLRLHLALVGRGHVVAHAVLDRRIDCHALVGRLSCFAAARDHP